MEGDKQCKVYVTTIAQNVALFFCSVATVLVYSDLERRYVPTRRIILERRKGEQWKIPTLFAGHEFATFVRER